MCRALIQGLWSLQGIFVGCKAKEEVMKQSLQGCIKEFTVVSFTVFVQGSNGFSKVLKRISSKQGRANRPQSTCSLLCNSGFEKSVLCC